MGFLSDANNFLFGTGKTTTVIEKAVLQMIYSTFVSVNSTCVSAAANDVAISIHSGGNVTSSGFSSSQVANALADCTSDQALNTKSTELTAKLVETQLAALLKTTNTAAQAAAAAGGNTSTGGGVLTFWQPSGTTTDNISQIAEIKNTIKGSQIQACVSTAVNTVTISDVTANSVEFAPTINQDADSDLAKCVNSQVSSGGGATLQQLVAAFAAGSHDNIYAGGATGGGIACAANANTLQTLIIVCAILIALLFLQLAVRMFVDHRIRTLSHPK